MRISVIVAIAAATIAMPAIAEDESDAYRLGSGVEADTSYEASRMRLMANGYRDVRMVEGDAMRVSAYDREGSEALLRINPQDGEILSSEYVYSMDR